ncbi:hypothetical protein N7490_010465 [Penicillium lividum]|nr:hypothetical protein N7490_010465 [Penicillium lividum]
MNIKASAFALITSVTFHPLIPVAYLENEDEDEEEVEKLDTPEPRVGTGTRRKGTGKKRRSCKCDRDLWLWLESAELRGYLPRYDPARDLLQEETLLSLLIL